MISKLNQARKDGPPETTMAAIYMLLACYFLQCMLTSVYHLYIFYNAAIREWVGEHCEGSWAHYATEEQAPW